MSPTPSWPSASPAESRPAARGVWLYRIGGRLIPMLAAVVTLSLLALAFGLLLGFAAIRFRVERDPIVDQVDRTSGNIIIGSRDESAWSWHNTGVDIGTPLVRLPASSTISSSENEFRSSTRPLVL